MKNIAIIGAGQLGSRHLQGVLDFHKPCRIYVVDTSKEALALSKKGYAEALLEKNAKYQKLILCADISELPDEIDFTIIATNSNVREQVLNQLLEKKINYLILEKVLFQDSNTLNQIKKKLEIHNVKCWVNHPRRAFTFYKNFKQKYLIDEKISYRVYGGNWGIGCNGLHFLDLLLFFADGGEPNISDINIKKVFPAKRTGYLEFHAEIWGNIGEHHFELICDDSADLVMIALETETLKATIDESKNMAEVVLKNKNNYMDKISEKIINPQSKLTGLILNDIDNTGSCDLPKYDEAIDLHAKFINAFLFALNKDPLNKYDKCPIT